MEDRTLLSPVTVDLTTFAQNLKNELGGLQTSINTALDAVTQVPFVGQHLGDIQQAEVFTNTLLTKLESTLDIVISGDSSTIVTMIQTTVQTDLFNLLGPGGAVPLLAAHDGSGTAPTASDVIVTVDPDYSFEVDMRLHEGLVNSTMPFGLNLGLGGLPFKVMSSGNVNIQVGFDYELAFKYDNATSDFSTDTSKVLLGNGPGAMHEMSLNVTASLPSMPTPFTATVIVGFLEGTVADHLVNGQGMTSMNLAFNLDGLDPNAPNINPSISGNAKLDLDLTGGFADGNNMVSTQFPSINTEFQLNWAFDTANPTSSDLPEVEFNNVEIGLGSFISSFIGPIVKDIQEVTEPLQPIINALQAPIPGLSDLSEAVGGGPVSLESIAKDFASASPIISLVTTLVDIVHTINGITISDLGTDSINLGSFNLGGPNSANGDLRDLPTAGDPTAGLGNLTSLIPDAPSLAASLDQQLSSFSGPAAADAKQALDMLTDPNGISLTFPILNDPVHSAFMLLLGQDAPLVQFTAHYADTVMEDASFGFFPLVVTFGGSINLDLQIGLAYDTYGIREFLNDPNHNGADFLDGLYIEDQPVASPTDPNTMISFTHVAIAGNISAGVGVGIPGLAELTVNGGVSTGNNGQTPVVLTLNDPDNDGLGHDNKLRASEIAYDLSNFPNCVFNSSGEIDGNMFIDFKVGLDVPFVGFVGYEKQFPLVSGELLNLNSMNNCNSANPPPPPVLASQPDANGQVTLFVGPNASMRQNVMDTSDDDVSYEVIHEGGTAGDETIGVRALGYTQMITGVSSIYAAGGAGQDVITVDQGVLSDAELHGDVGNDTLTYLGSGSATLYGNVGDDHLTVGPNAQAATIYGGGGNDVLRGGGGAETLNGQGGPNDMDTLIAGPGNNQTLNGGMGQNQFYAGTGSSVMNGGPGSNTYVWNAGDGAITINGMGTQNILEVDDNSGNADAIIVTGNANGHTSAQFNGNPIIDAADIQELNIDTSKSPDAVTVNSLSATPVQTVALNLFSEASTPDNVTQTYTLNGAAGPKTVTINEVSASGTVSNTINGMTTTTTASGTVTQVTGLGPTFLVANPEDKLIVAPGDRNTTVNIATQTQAGTLEVDGGNGTDVYNVQSTSAATTIKAQGGQNTFNVGSAAPAFFGNVVGHIQGALTVVGSGGSDAMYVSDIADTTSTTGTLTSAKITGLGTAGISFSGLSMVNVTLGAGSSNQFNIQSTAAGVSYFVGGFFGTDTFDVGSMANDMPTNRSVLNTIQGPLTLSGDPGDTANLDDTGNPLPETGKVTATSFTGMGMGASGITYSGLMFLNIWMGTGGDTMNIQSTAAGTTTTIDPPTGSPNTFNVGSKAPATGGIVDNIKGPLVIVGSGADTMNVDDTGSTMAKTGTLTQSTLTGLNMAGITYSGLAVLNIALGSGANTFTINVSSGKNLPATTTINGGSSNDSSLMANWATDFNGTLNLLGFEFATIAIGGNYNGTLSDTGSIQSLTIGGGLGPAATLHVTGNLTEMTLGPAMFSPGHDMAGTIIVGGTLGDLRVAGGTPGNITAGLVGTIRTFGGYGPYVLQIKENGIQRRIEAAVPSSPFPALNIPPVPTATSPAGVTFQYFYEGLYSPTLEGLNPSTNLANPQLTARVTNATGNTGPDQFDFSLVTYNDTAKFNLVRLDATGNSGVSGIRNVAVEGNVLTKITTAASGFFPNDTSPTGVYLPKDNLAGVAVRDFAPDYFINAKSIQAVAFGSITGSNGVIETGAASNGSGAFYTLAFTTLVVPAGSLNVNAGETFRVPFADLPTQQVGFFMDSSASSGHFDNNDVVLVVQGVSTANSSGTGNNVTPSNVARGAVVALITVAQTFGNGVLHNSVIQNIFLQGDGGSIQTYQPVGNTSTLPKQSFIPSITSTGPLGDVSVLGALPNVTAPSIFGSLLPSGPIPVTSTIQTTGVRTDPINGATSQVPADLGRIYVTTTKSGPVVTATQVQSNGALAGQIICGGNLISQVVSNGATTGVVTVKPVAWEPGAGNLGTTFTYPSTTVVRLGGFVSNGAMSAGSSILTAGSVNGNITISGPLGGRLVSIGNINGNVSTGAVQGGLIATSGAINGNLTIAGALSGQLVSVGNINGNVTINGGLQSGRIAALGSILGNLTISGSIDSKSALVSGGSIGGPSGKLSVGNIYGIVAAVGSINVAKIGSTNTALYYKPNDTLDAAVIDAIFMQGVSPLSPTDLFDKTTPLDLQNLSVILSNLNSLTVKNGTLQL